MSDLTTICTVRHGQTDYTLQKRYAGTTDVPLNKTGIEDTKQASKKLIGMHFDIIITSTLQRSIQTAKLLFNDDVKFIQSEYCNERNYGAMQGLTEDEVKVMTPRVDFIEVANDYHSLNPSNGETFPMLRKRAEKFHKFIFDTCAGLTTLIISHGVFLQQFHGLLHGLDWKQSLATNVSSLELATFRFRNNRLVSNSITKLVERDQINW